MTAPSRTAAGTAPMKARHPRSLRLALALAAATFGSVAQAADLDVAIGKALFRRAWVPAPASTRANDGLGPLHNARACAGCHQGLERPAVIADPTGRVTGEALVLRLGDAEGRPDPTYGRQFQTGGVAGIVPEIAAAFREPSGLVRPQDLAYGPLAEGTRVGALLAPALRGLGALDAVSDETLIALASASPTGGRVRWIETPKGLRAGRFGAKSGSPRLADQVSLAFHLDLGLSTETFPDPWGDCTPAQAACRRAPHGAGAEAEGPEIAPAIVTRIAAYLASIPAPDPDPSPRGEALFAQAGCAACHLPALPSPGGPVRAHTDLLLHDLGPGLAGAPEPGAGASEWRTAPLWGLSTRLGAGLLHDGRAPTVAAAVRWHGGTATGARAAFDALAPADRAALVAYLEGL